MNKLLSVVIQVGDEPELCLFTNDLDGKAGRQLYGAVRKLMSPMKEGDPPPVLMVKNVNWRESGVAEEVRIGLVKGNSPRRAESVNFSDMLMVSDLIEGVIGRQAERIRRESATHYVATVDGVPCRVDVRMARQWKELRAKGMVGFSVEGKATPINPSCEAKSADCRYEMRESGVVRVLSLKGEVQPLDFDSSKELVERAYNLHKELPTPREIVQYKYWSEVEDGDYNENTLIFVAGGLPVHSVNLGGAIVVTAVNPTTLIHQVKCGYIFYSMR